MYLQNNVLEFRRKTTKVVSEIVRKGNNKRCSILVSEFVTRYSIK